MNENIYITQHAYKMAKERLGLSNKSLDRLAKRAISEGLCLEDTRGKNIYNYVVKKTKMQRTKKDDEIFIRVYGEVVYIFADNQSENVLLTMYQLPNIVRKEAIELMNEKRNENSAVYQCCFCL